MRAVFHQRRIAVGVALVAPAALVALAAPAVRAQESAWGPGPSMRHARSAHAIADDGTAVWVLGGTGDGGRPVLDVERFDGQTWSVESRIPGAGLNAPAAVWLDGLIYLIGGFNTTTNVPTDRVLVYDPAARTWREAAPLPAPRGGHAAVVLNARIHVLGGGNSQSTIADHSVYDPATDRWQDAAPLSRPKGSPAAVVLDGRIWTIGGRSGYDDFGDVEVYDPATQSWSAGPGIEPRGTHGAVVYHGAIHIFGGESQARRSVLGSVQRFDHAKATWQELAPMPSPRNYGRAVVLGDVVFVIGGNTSVANSHSATGSTIVERFTVR